jgi:1,4-alpha-glucan branching enzyme
MRITFLATVALVIFAATARADVEHEFTFKPEGNPAKVVVAGDFNNWSQDKNPLTRGADGTWRARVQMPEGIHHYKFVVDG